MFPGTMLLHIVTFLSLTLGIHAQTQDAFLNNRTTPALNITAISTQNNASSIQCWQLTPFQVSSTPGTKGALAAMLANTTSVGYQIIEGRTNAGLHNAPVPQLVYYASGLIRLSVPNTTEEAWVVGGKYGLIYADDTADKSQYGHLTEYVSDADTIAMTFPLAKGQELEHKVLHLGACRWEEMAGL